MKLIDAMCNVLVLWIVIMILEAIAIKNGYRGELASQDARLIFDGLVIAGTLISRG